MLQALENRQAELGVVSYSFAVEQLEDTLLKVIETAEAAYEGHDWASQKSFSPFTLTLSLFRKTERCAAPVVKVTRHRPCESSDARDL